MMSKERVGFQLVQGNAKIEWVELGEGRSGDYNPDDPCDVELLRFDTFFRPQPGQDAQDDPDEDGWVTCHDGSYCTLVPVSTPPDVRQVLLIELMAAMHEAIGQDRVKKIAERCSWITEDGLDARMLRASRTLPETTFHNVTITVAAESAKMAYQILCAMLASPLVEYNTDTYTTGLASPHRPTKELWPKDGGTG